jgi:4-hydroxy-tetrahydrodipicolinate reductase
MATMRTRATAEAALKAKGKGRLRVVQYGLGPIGLATVRAVLARPDFELVGAIDIDQEKIDRDVADLSGLKRPSGIRVSGRAEEVLAVTRPKVVLHTTSSRLDRIMPQLRACLDSGASVVSTCEELLLPSLRNPALAQELAALAQARGVAVLGTGVNPGLVMDTVALLATAPCLEVRSVRVERVVDASTRRLPLQRKIGAGMSRAEFKEKVGERELGHVGLLESLSLVALGLGWKLERVEEKIVPVVAAKSVKTPFLTVKAGQVAGLHHTCRGFRDGKEVLSLDLQMYLGAKNPYDQVTVAGRPPLKLRFDGGVPGDEATVAMLLNMASLVAAAPPGLKTMLDVPVPRFHLTG